MKRLLVLAALAAGSMCAQNVLYPTWTSATTQGTITTAGNGTDCAIAASCTWIVGPTWALASKVVVTGSFTGTLTFESATDGKTWGSIASTTGYTNTATPGTFYFQIPQVPCLRIRASALTSGAAQIAITALNYVPVIPASNNYLPSGNGLVKVVNGVGALGVAGTDYDAGGAAAAAQAYASNASHITAGRLQNARLNVNAGSTLNYYGDSICAGTGATIPANQWTSIFSASVGTGVSTNRCLTGALIGDVVDFGILLRQSSQVSLAPYNLSEFNGGLSMIYIGHNDANGPANALTAAQEMTYQEQLAAAIVLTTIPTNQWIQASNTSVTTSGTVTKDDWYYSILPGDLITSTSGTVTFSVTTSGAPIYLLYQIFNSDTGTATVTIDGSAATDSITSSATLYNAPFGGGTIYGSFTRSLAAARYPVASGTHTVVLTCTAPGTNGCGFQLAGTVPFSTEEYGLPTVAVSGVIRQNGDAKSATTAAYDGLNNTVTSLLASDGLNAIFVPDRNFLNATNYAAAMSSTDGYTSAAAIRTDVSTTSGSTTITSATGFDSSFTGKLAYCAGVGAGSTTLHTTASSFNIASPTQIVLASAPSVTSTSVSCQFGNLGQVYPASTSAGLHPNDWGHLLIARAFLSKLQPTSLAPNYSNFVTFTGGAAFNLQSSTRLFNMNASSQAVANGPGSLPIEANLYTGNGTTTTSIGLWWRNSANVGAGTTSPEVDVVAQNAKEVGLCDQNAYPNVGTSLRCNFLMDNGANGGNGMTFLKGLAAYIPGTAIASGATIAPISEITHVTGTAAIATITVPSTTNVGSLSSTTFAGCLTLIADGAWTTTTAGNINAAMTAVAGTPYQACYDGAAWFIK